MDSNTKTLEERIKELAKSPSNVSHNHQVVRRTTALDRTILNKTIAPKTEQNRKEHIAGMNAILKDDSVYKGNNENEEIDKEELTHVLRLPMKK